MTVVVVTCVQDGVDHNSWFAGGLVVKYRKILSSTVFLRSIIMRHVAITVCLFLVLTACGGSGGGSSGGFSGPATTLSGTASFEKVSPLAAGGLDYAGAENLPIRGARVEARSTTGTVYSSASTDALGAFSLDVPQDSTVRLVVLARVTVAGGEITVGQNATDPMATSGQILGIYRDIAVGTNPTIGNIHAASGWTGSGYTEGGRHSAPFAILDVLYRARELIRTTAPGDDAPPVDVFWGPDYTGATIGTSHYQPSTNVVRILGQENVDTDEFDHAVIAHEWGHVYQGQVSRDDSLGGPHAVGDYLDETVAFSEAFANAVSGMVMAAPFYRDTMGSLQATTAVALDLRTDQMCGNPGPWSEFSLAGLLYDIYDSDTVTNNGLGLGFVPIHRVMRDDIRVTPSFATIYPFLYHIKEQVSTLQASAIANRAAADGIAVGHDIFDGEDYPYASGYRYQRDVPTNGTLVTVDVDGDPLQSWDGYGQLNANAYNPGNKLYNRIYLLADLPSAGDWMIRVTPVDDTGVPNDGDVILWVANGPRIDETWQGAETVTLNTTAAGTVAFAAAAFTAGQRFVVEVGTSDQLTKPVVPDGDG